MRFFRNNRLKTLLVVSCLLLSAETPAEKKANRMEYGIHQVLLHMGFTPKSLVINEKTGFFGEREEGMREYSIRFNEMTKNRKRSLTGFTCRATIEGSEKPGDRFDIESVTISECETMNYMEEFTSREQIPGNTYVKPGKTSVGTIRRNRVGGFWNFTQFLREFYLRDQQEKERVEAEETEKEAVRLRQQKMENGNFIGLEQNQPALENLLTIAQSFEATQLPMRSLPAFILERMGLTQLDSEASKCNPFRKPLHYYPNDHSEIEYKYLESEQTFFEKRHFFIPEFQEVFSGLEYEGREAAHYVAYVYDNEDCRGMPVDIGLGSSYDPNEMPASMKGDFEDLNKGLYMVPDLAIARKELSLDQLFPFLIRAHGFHYGSHEYQDDRLTFIHYSHHNNAPLVKIGCRVRRKGEGVQERIVLSSCDTETLVSTGTQTWEEITEVFRFFIDFFFVKTPWTKKEKLDPGPNKQVVVTQIEKFLDGLSSLVPSLDQENQKIPGVFHPYSLQPFLTHHLGFTNTANKPSCVPAQGKAFGRPTSGKVSDVPNVYSWRTYPLVQPVNTALSALEERDQDYFVAKIYEDKECTKLIYYAFGSSGTEENNPAPIEGDGK